jgi:hypothetical protein
MIVFYYNNTEENEMTEMVFYKNGLRFECSGGNYIAIFEKHASVPFEAYNVWNYDTDEPRIDRTQEAFEEYVLGELSTADRIVSLLK